MYLKNLTSYIQRFLEYYQNFPEREFNMIANGLITELVLLICNTPNETPQLPSDLKPLTKQLINYIDEHIKERITLNDLSQHFHLAANYISIFFKQEMHIPIITYIKNKQLTNINIALKNGESPTQIFFQYGFSNYSNFFRLYKKTFGYPPSNVLPKDKN